MSFSYARENTVAVGGKWMADDNKVMHYVRRHWSQYERQAEPQYDEGNGATVIYRRAMTGFIALRFYWMYSYRTSDGQ